MHEPLVLEGRDAIRRYMARQGVNRSWKTLKKWKECYGLPVKQRPETKLVYAIPAELDEWILRWLIGKD